MVKGIFTIEKGQLAAEIAKITQKNQAFQFF